MWMFLSIENIFSFFKIRLLVNRKTTKSNFICEYIEFFYMKLDSMNVECGRLVKYYTISKLFSLFQTQCNFSHKT